MRFRLLRRRLTVSAPRVSVRSTLPWPFRWLFGALMLGFSAALAVWAFEFGKDIAGLDRNAQQELAQLRREVRILRTDLSEAQMVANTSDSLLIAERSTQEQLTMQIRQLQADNELLRSDLGFFERLIPGSGNDSLSIRGLQAERLSPTQLKWQVLMIQASKNAPDFKGALEVTLTGTLAGKPWTVKSAPTPQPVLIKGYLRMEGVVDVPAQAVVENVTAKILQGTSVRSMQSFNLYPSRSAVGRSSCSPRKNNPPSRASLPRAPALKAMCSSRMGCASTAKWSAICGPATKSPASWW